jgi:hypothetical protein
MEADEAGAACSRYAADLPILRRLAAHPGWRGRLELGAQKQLAEFA